MGEVVMRWTLAQWVTFGSLVLGLLGAPSGFAATQDLGQGFLDHGRIAAKKLPNAAIRSFAAPLIATTPEGTICASMEYRPDLDFYDPKTDSWKSRPTRQQWSAMCRQGDRFFGAGHDLQEWNPAERWVAQEKNGPRANPCTLSPCSSPIGDPLDLLALPDGKTIVVAGSSNGFADGSWLLFWNRETRMPIYVGQESFLEDQWTVSLAALPDNKLIGGSTVAEEPPTLTMVPIDLESDAKSKYKEPTPEMRIIGGSRDALIANADSPPLFFEEEFRPCELFIMDVATKRLEWHAAPFQDAKAITALWTAPSSLVYGLARISVSYLAYKERERWNPKRFFVFDPVQRKVIHQEDLDSSAELSITCDGRRPFVVDDRNTLYLLYRKGIAQVNPGTHAVTMLAESPVTIGGSGAWLDGRVYFVSEERLCSYTPAASSAP
jgi:hypothetical protein